MPKYRKSGLNGTSMISIQELSQSQVLLLLRQKYDLKREREQINNKIREMRKEAYNLSLKINEYETKIDTYILKQVR
jgi:uncharacterized protein YeeX (DUF496 family)